MNKSGLLRKKLKQLRDEVENVLKKGDIPLSVRGIWLVVKTVRGLEEVTLGDVSSALRVIARRKHNKGRIKVSTEIRTVYTLAK